MAFKAILATRHNSKQRIICNTCLLQFHVFGHLNDFRRVSRPGPRYQLTARYPGIWSISVSDNMLEVSILDVIYETRLVHYVGTSL